jgi:hypothetical protein
LFSLISFAKARINLSAKGINGNGFPLQKFDKVKLAFLINKVSGFALFAISAIIFNALV